MNGWRRALVIAAAIWLALLALTPWTTLWDRDEPRFVEKRLHRLGLARLVRKQPLERDPPPSLCVLGDMDRCHPTDA